MLKIELSDLKFYSFHGVHEEETKTGGDFEVNLVVYFKPKNLLIKHMDETIDYTLLYELIRLRMDKPTRLLETIATEIATEILNKFSQIEEIQIKIDKLNPPIPFFKGRVAAEYILTREELNR